MLYYISILISWLRDAFNPPKRPPSPAPEHEIDHPILSPATKPPTADSTPEIIHRLKSELCETWLQERATRWGPDPCDASSPPSWKGTVTTTLGSTSHYITCHGHAPDNTPCNGTWSRKDRHALPNGVYCTLGKHIVWDGSTIATPFVGEGRSLQELRRIWGEYVLRDSPGSVRKSGQKGMEGGGEVTGIWDQSMMDSVHGMLRKAMQKKTQPQSPTTSPSDSNPPTAQKTLGSGTGGWPGLSPSGNLILKRDASSRPVAPTSRCDLEPGGLFSTSDVDVWTVWNGWSCLISRDGRFRPAYHLELCLCLWTAVVDYGLTRASYRDRGVRWIKATEWLWTHTPWDVTRDVVRVFGSDAGEMIRREKERVGSLKRGSYVADAIGTREERYRAYQDRAGEVIAYHSVGEGLETERGMVVSWAMIVLNDVLDYERDVLCGETNNFVRGVSGGQQVVDVAAGVLDALLWAMERRDDDLMSAILGTAAIYLTIWRYNGPKLGRYEAVSVRNVTPGAPPEMEDVLDIVRPRVTGTGGERAERTYGEIFDKAKESVEMFYSGCTCRTPPEGHDAWQLFAQAMDQGGNDELEERLQVALVALNNGANAGDVNCECGIDLLLVEAFSRFLDPDAGIVVRLHYRSGITEQGNTFTE
ncbi:hypothetical protein QBC34DRAFT_306955 [Podospora aff. communis PSN243]|uniref:Uncharacterized protein n=1 Tax=Podospora aff. communis PSN243 TaxID=3040156 RepID=A0AAV9GD93_9PEZI|nr:hypothetical protein QBC34DRAFT_306955 [Podospora aff. communis PSN243]